MPGPGAGSACPERWLAAGELEVLRGVAEPVRRLEWLRGRALAKVAVRRVAGMRLAPSAVEIGAETRGAPFGRVVGRAEAISLSISHSGAWTACARLPCGAVGAVGVDVERLDDELAALAGRFASAREWAWAADTCGATLGAAILWSAKESAIKCVAGRIVRRRSFEVRPDGAGLRVAVHAAGDEPPRVLFGGCARLPGHVLTWLSAARRPTVLERLPGIALDRLAGLSDAEVP
jgi:4'-phosphopantetheinyl transferase EntD